MFENGNGKGIMALNRRRLLLGLAGLALAMAIPGPARAEKREEGTIITNFNRPSTTALFLAPLSGVAVIVPSSAIEIC